MLFLMLPLAGLALRDMFLLLWGSNQLLLKRILRSDPPDSVDSEAALDEYRIQASLAFSDRDSWYRLLQLAGPAVGFTLTVSSLIVALHPSVQSNLDPTGFFSAIQAAMTSTFLGLSVRIIALLLGKINDLLLIKGDSALELIRIDSTLPEEEEG